MHARGDAACQEALWRIEEAAAAGAASLDLSYLDLEALPPEIGQLIHLNALDLSDNQLTALPPELGQLINLAELALDGNPLPAEYLADLAALLAYLRE